MDSDISLLKFEDAGDKMVHSGAAVLPICHWRPSESASAETFDLKHWRVRQWRHVFDHNTFMVLIPLRHILDSLNTPRTSSRPEAYVPSSWDSRWTPRIPNDGACLFLA